MKTQPDTDDLSMKEHAWLCAFALIVFAGCAGAIWHTAPDRILSQSRYHDASLEPETAKDWAMDAPETTEQKLARIKARDEATRSK